MNLIIERIDNIGMDYYYVTVTCNGSYLQIETPQRLLKELKRELPIRALEDVHWQVNGRIRRLVFTYKEEVYRIVDVGGDFEKQIANRILSETLV